MSRSVTSNTISEGWIPRFRGSRCNRALSKFPDSEPACRKRPLWWWLGNPAWDLRNIKRLSTPRTRRSHNKGDPHNPHSSLGSLSPARDSETGSAINPGKYWFQPAFRDKTDTRKDYIMGSIIRWYASCAALNARMKVIDRCSPIHFPEYTSNRRKWFYFHSYEFKK
jgi:hypothetical protein